MIRPLRVVGARTRWLRGRALHRAEVRRGARLDARPDRTPIFILGAPRSGTTLLYQLLVEGLDVGWLSNAHMATPEDVSRIERDARPRATRDAPDFESTHGATAGDWGPSEAGEFWYRAFPRRPHQAHAADATPARTRAVRAIVREFMDACESSVVFKNVFSSLRVPVLAAALPEARFVHIERELESNARSLLAGRARRGDLDAWWSAEPDGVGAVRGRTPAEQVVWQVVRMNEVASRELEALDPDRSLVVGYEQLCADPARTLDGIHRWLAKGSSAVQLRTDARIPDSFERRAGGLLEPALEQQLLAALASEPTREDAS